MARHPGETRFTRNIGILPIFAWAGGGKAKVFLARSRPASCRDHVTRNIGILPP
jgi:hypothetical protein